MILPFRITFVPFACSTVSVPLGIVVSVQPSTVTGVPSEVITVTVMSSLSGLKMSDAPPSTKGASGGAMFPPPVPSLGSLHALTPNSASAEAAKKIVFSFVIYCSSSKFFLIGNYQLHYTLINRFRFFFGKAGRPHYLFSQRQGDGSIIKSCSGTYFAFGNDCIISDTVFVSADPSPDFIIS